MTEHSERLGSASDTLLTPEVPRYAEMREFVFEQQGWDPADFDLHRLRIEYPVLSSLVLLTYSLDPTK